MENNYETMLRAGFEELFPEYAKRMNNAVAVSPDAVLNTYNEIYSECLEQAQPFLRLARLADERSVAGPFMVDTEQYTKMAAAEKDEIKYQVQKLMNTLEYLKSVENQSNTVIAANLAVSGLCALESTSFVVAKTIMKAGASTFEAALGAVTSCKSAIIAVVTLVVVAIIIPFLYFMSKPANCIVLLINELDETVSFADDYNVHGKPVTFVEELPPVIKVNEGAVAYSVGIITTQKRDQALYGTQYGFRMKSENGVPFTFGVDCPLNGSNNCFCSFTDSPEDAAKHTDDKNKQSYTADKDNLHLSIKCHSKSGSIAYYIARIYQD